VIGTSVSYGGIYGNLLNREVEQGGLEFWSAEFKTMDKTAVLNNILYAAHERTPGGSHAYNGTEYNVNFGLTVDDLAKETAISTTTKTITYSNGSTKTVTTGYDLNGVAFTR
jgi:hypothetical protein